MAQAMAGTEEERISARQLVGHPQLGMGAVFNLPGITYWSEQIENNDQISTTLATGTQVVAQYPANLTNTDVLYREMVEFTITQSIALGGGALTTSPYFPYSYLGPVSLSMQNQFNTFDVLNGIDAKIFELIRPQYPNNQSSNMWETNPVTDPYSIQTNQQSASNYTSASGTLKFNLDIPMGINFDKYYDLDPDGQLRGNMGPARAFVTPQLMSGSNRIVTPRLTYNPINAATVDNGPYNITGGAPVLSASSIQGWQRKIVYQPHDATDTPVIWGWQYTREAKQYSLSGRSTIDIPLPITGQLLMLYYRFFDPSAAAGLGAVIVITSVKNLWLQYGSGLYKFQDTFLRAQRRFERQHLNTFPPEGVLVHDMVEDEMGLASNQNALNTLDTSSCKIHFDFTVTLSATAYVVIGVESLRYVTQS